MPDQPALRSIGGGRARRTFGAPLLHHQVFRGIEELALSTALDDTSPLPTEAQLSEHFGVSRGTVRKATEELVRNGLLRSEVGRGTFVDKRSQARTIVRARLIEVARPDSRFHLDIAQFVPDFDGSTTCHQAVRGLDSYSQAGPLFIAPDHSLEALRHAALDDGHVVVVPTYGMRRGMIRLDPASIPSTERRFAATLDGMEQLGQSLTIDELVAVGPIDLEWAILAELGLVDARTPTVCVVHDCQVIDAELAPGPFDITIDVVVTPSQTHVTDCDWSRPTGIAWGRLDDDLRADVAYLVELEARSTAQLLHLKDPT